MAKSKYRRNGTAHRKRKNSPITALSMSKPITEASLPTSTSSEAANSRANATVSETVSPDAVSPDAVSPDAVSPDAKRLDQIRDILFGQQVQTHDRRFESLEQRLSEDYTHLRSDFLDRIEALESRLMDHIDSLTGRIRDEETTRDRQGTTLDEKIADTNKDLRAEIKHQTLTLTANLEQQIEDVLRRLEQESTVRKQVTNVERTRLSNLLGELSKQLSTESAAASASASDSEARAHDTASLSETR